MSRELEVATSYLADIDKSIQSIESSDNPLINENTAKEAINGDLKLALREIDKAAATGIDVSEERARALLSKGRIANAVAASAGPGFKDVHKKWTNKAIEAFTESIQQSPSATAYYCLGLCYHNINRKAEALDALRKVEQYGDSRLSIEATKWMGRIDEKKGPCYIATACYDSYDHPDVLVLRRFRDEQLLKSRSGAWFVHTYYALSPGIARRLGNCRWLSAAVRSRLLEPLVRRLRR